MAQGEHTVHLIKNTQSGKYLSLWDGYRDTENYAVTTPEADDINYFKQLWLLVDTKQQSQDGKPIFKIRCLQSGTDLNMYQNQSPINGEQGIYYTVGQIRHDFNNQRWTFNHTGNGSQYYIRNYDSGRFLDLNENGGNQYAVCKDASDSPSQIWDFERRSRGWGEIAEMLKQGTKIGDKFDHFQADGAYLNLPQKIIDEIYNTGLVGIRYKWRSEIFDCDDFAINMKAEVAKWAYDKIKCDDVSILMGIFWGTHPTRGAHAFNWYLQPDLKSIKMYEPQTGIEETHLMDHVGWYASF